MGKYVPHGKQLEEVPVRLIEIILAVILPPVAVLLRVGLGGQFLLSILLTLLGHLPGVIYALWVVTRP
jgi:uncharacterized membrane protein YqaE (UPF0057 family)